LNNIRQVPTEILAFTVSLHSSNSTTGYRYAQIMALQQYRIGQKRQKYGTAKRKEKTEKKQNKRKNI
jgi:phosphoribosylcarboxyaminoimidazole (NCAIR) mutase